MIDSLRSHLTSRLGGHTGQLDAVLSHFRHVRFQRGEQLLRQGDVCNHVWFIAAGCLQVYVYDSSYNETTRDIVLEDNWCSELISFSQRVPATENIRAIEDTDLLAISQPSFQALMASVAPFAQVYQQVLEASHAGSVHRVNALVSLSALEKIRWVAAHRPQLFTRVSSKLVASYLGISQETYSRLKSKV